MDFKVSAFNIDKFLTNGAFLVIPNRQKIWTMTNVINSFQRDKSKISFYKNDFFLNEEKPWLSGEYESEFNIEDFNAILNQIETINPIFKWEKVDFDFYEKKFNLLKNEISKGDILKGVPFLHKKCFKNLNQNDIAYLLKNLFANASSENLFLYGAWDLKKSEGFIGASPELLFEQKMNLVETFALAGTISEENNVEHLCSKILQEHNYVVDGIRNQLSLFGEIETKGNEILKFNKFSHLKSNFLLHLNEQFDFEKVVHSIHPTPALGTYPKEEGKNWLNIIENTIEKRGHYCSPFGIILNDEYSICIEIIRGLQWKNNMLEITAGGGVIEESDYHSECNEILLKLDSIQNYFNV